MTRVYGNAVAIDGGEILLSINIDGGEVLPSISIDGGEVGAVMPIMPDQYTGELTVIPKAYEEQVLRTAFKTMPGDVVVHVVPYWETSNPDGQTVYIASEV